MHLWEESVNHLIKTISAVHNGSITYTKPLFCLVKCTILARPWSMQSRMKVLMVSRFGGVGVLQVLPGLKGDELQKMLFWLGGNWGFLPR